MKRSWVLAIWVRNRFSYYAGTDSGRSVWIPVPGPAMKFPSQREAESFGLLFSTREPELIGKVEVLEHAG